MQAEISLKGTLCPEIMQRVNISIGIYKPAIITFLIVLCFVFAAKAQEIEVNSTPVAEAVGEINQSEINPLKIGDRIPDELWSLPLQVVNHPEGKTTITLDDYRDKLIILDFWATWCPPCIRSLQKLDTIQKEFSEGLVVIPVTLEEGSKIGRYIKDKQWSLPSVVKGKILGKTFPHRAVPFQVWLKDGKVVATTHANQATQQNIQDLLESDNYSNIILRKDNFSYNNRVPLFLNGNGTTGMDLKYHSVITGYMTGVFGGGGSFTDSIGRKKIVIMNADLGRLYRTAAGRYNRKLSKINRLVISESRIQDLIPKGKPHLDSSLTKYFYTYELLAPPLNDTLLSKFMIEDLNRFFGYQHRVKAEIKMQEIPCWIVSQKKPEREANNKNNEYISETLYFSDRIEFKNEEPEEVIRILEELDSDIRIPLINEVEQKRIDLTIPTYADGIINFEEVKKAMEHQGFAVKIEKRMVEVIVIDSI